MSLRMEMEKKKKLEEMRRLMAERKKKGIQPVKIENPLAKYNNAGQLTCILCSSVVRSENVWQIHLNSKQHQNNVEQAKKLKELTNNFTVNKPKLKRSNAPSYDAPEEKKPKGILKNATPHPILIPNKIINPPSVVLYHNEEIKRAPLNVVESTSSKLSKLDYQPRNIEDTSKNSKEEDQTQTTVEQPIPEGFFDDPILDAKVRNIEYKDPVEEEWEKFRKEIKEEASASAEIIAGEQEEATAERQIDEIDEQIRNWSRVLDLELKKDETKKKIQEVEQMSESENNSEDDDEIDEFLDWRAKKA